MTFSRVRSKFNLPEELFGEVLLLDRANPDAQLDFTRRFGPLSEPVWWPLAALETELPLYESQKLFWIKVATIRSSFNVYNMIGKHAAMLADVPDAIAA